MSSHNTKRRCLRLLFALALMLPALPLHSGASQAMNVTHEPSGILVSSHPDRSNPQPVEQTLLKGDAFIFMDVARNVRRVSYFLNDPEATNAPWRTSDDHPFDLEGTVGNAARPFDTTTLDDGEYTLTAQLLLANGRVQVVHARVVVHTAHPDPEPEPDPEPGDPEDDDAKQPSPLAADVLVVVDAEGSGSHSKSIVDRLASREATVTTAPDASVDDAEAHGMDLIVISPDVSASTVGARFRDLPVPQVNLRSSNWRPHNQSFGQDERSKHVSTQLTIVDPDHAAAAGYTGTIDVGASIGWQLVGASPDAHLVATTEDGEPSMVVYEAGSEGVDGVFFPTRRAILGVDEDDWNNANEELWAIFDGLVDWAVAGEVADPSEPDPAPEPEPDPEPDPDPEPQSDPDVASNPNPVDPAEATHTIPRSMSTADGQGNMSNVQPGDVVAIESGSRRALRLRNFHGTADNPITFVNDGGIVVISDSAGTYAGLDIRDSSYIRVTGSGAPGGNGRTVGSAAYEPGMTMADLEAMQDAGIRVRGVDRGVAFKFWRTASDTFPDGGVITQGLEIDHLDLSTIKNGIHGPESDRLSDDYTLVGYRIHHNHIHNTQTHEGMYLGSGNYPDPYADTGEWEVDHNFIHHTGRDAIQLGNAWYGKSRIHRNVTYRPGQADTQDSFGIILRRGSVADVDSNYVFDSGRDGIRDHGINGSRFYNNVVVRGGHFSDSSTRGIRLSTSRDDAPSEHLVGNEGGAKVWNNTVVGFPDQAIHFTNGADDSVNVARNNIMWDNGGTIRTSSGTSATTSHNLSADPLFVRPDRDDYRLRSGSRAIDAGYALPGLVELDILTTARPQGSGWDVGAHEHVN